MNNPKIIVMDFAAKIKEIEVKELGLDIQS